jgi:5-methylcytosine-specific restriction endonuclease McrA
MWTLPLPSCTAATAYDTCIQGIQDTKKKERFTTALAEVLRADNAYQAAGAQQDFGKYLLTDSAASVLRPGDMSWLYEHRMVNSKPGRAIYDQILRATPHGKCPLCGHRQVRTLDHYLPKSAHPALAVNPANLIPACGDCNHDKLDTTADTLHPYYDDIDGAQWLRARVLMGNVPAVEFFVDTPAAWSSWLADRVNGHFKLFKLGMLYANEAAEELSGNWRLCATVYAEAKADGVRAFLVGHADSRRAHRRNWWPTALYDALAASDWYCDGGFRF